MAEQAKCPDCGAPESWMASGHEIGGKRCLRRQLAAKDAEIAKLRELVEAVIAIESEGGMRLSVAIGDLRRHVRAKEHSND